MKASEKLRELMKRRNLSQEDLAQKAGVTQSAISGYMRNKSTTGMKAGIAKRICDVFEVSLDWFFDDKQGMKSLEELAMEKQIAQMVAALGMQAAFNRLMKIEPKEGMAGGSTSPQSKPDFGPIGLSGSPGEPAPKSAQPRGGKSRRSNG